MNLISEVDLGVIRRNLARVRNVTATRVLVMVKADAYGHGMTEVARALRDEADFFGVATLEEGVELRRNGITTPVLVTICGADELVCAARNVLTAAVADFGTLRAVADMPPDARPAFHLKVDTGMHRLGISPDEVPEAVRFMAERGVAPEGVYSHFREPNGEQLAVFDEAAKAVKARFPNAIAHIASSSSAGMKGATYDMVRVGHAVYDGAMTVRSRVVAVRQARAGECVGYGHFRLKKDTALAVVFGGYFDGVRRESPSPVLIGGKLCPVCGSVCMDMFAADVGGLTVRKGDEVVLLGGGLPASAVAAARNTTDYEVMTCWQGRVQRIYRDETGSENESRIGRGENECGGEGMGV